MKFLLSSPTFLILQSAAAYARVKVLFGKTLSEFNGDEIIALANFALAIPAAELLSMNTTAYE